MANGKKKGFKDGMDRTEHFQGEDMAYMETRPDLRATYDDQFTQVADTPMKNAPDSERGYIPGYMGKERMGVGRDWNKVRPRAEGSR